MSTAVDVSLHNPSYMKKEALRVLVVDDYEDNRTVLKMMLRRRGAVVLEAVDGQDAIEVADREHPDIILMDLSMPVLDGFEATRYLKQHPDTQHISIIAVSAHCGDVRQRDKAFGVGCIDCLDKPLDWGKIGELLTLIDERNSIGAA